MKELKEKGTMLSLGATKNKSGSYINTLDIPTGLLPGNFGCRVIDQMMPTEL